METSKSKIKAVSFCRVSSREQEETGYSLDAQEKMLKEYAIDKFTIVKTFRISESASGRQIRKTFNEMLQYVAKNKVPIILCEKIDRLTRNLKDAAIVSDWLHDDKGREVHFVKESFVVNQNTRAHENLVWDMKVAIARFYTNNLSEEVKKGHKEKASQGWLPTKPPLGYKTIGEKGHKTHIIDENIAPLVRKMFELYSTGNYSVLALIKIMHREGLRTREGKKVSKSRMHEYLADPFYYGKFRWNGEIHQGQHEPLFSKELWDVVQGKHTRQIKNPQYKKHLPVFKAKIECEECGATLTWSKAKGHWYGHHSSYVKHKECSRRVYVRQELVEEQLFPYFEKAAPKNERVLKWLEKALKEGHADEIDYNTNKRNELTRIVQSSDQRLEGAYRDKLDGRIPAALCEKMMADATNEKEEALDSLKKLSESRTKYYEAGYAIHELALKAKDIYSSSKTTPEDQRLLLSYIFSNHSINADKIKPNYTLAYEFLAEWMPRCNRIFELEETLVKQGKKEAIASSHPVLLRGQDSNL